MMMHRYFLMRSYLMRCLSTLFCALLTTLVFSADAAAVDIERSTVVTSVQIEPVGEFFDLINNGQVIDQIALVGRDECVKLFENDTPISFFFNFSAGGNQTTFHSARIFAAPTQVTPEGFSCDLESRTSCSDVENIEEFRLPDGGVNATYGQAIDFEDLVSKAVEGQEFESDELPRNEILLLQDASDCNDEPVDQQYFIRLLFTSAAQPNRGEAFDAVIELDTMPPPAPSSVSNVVVTENSVFANWEQTEGRDDLNLDVRTELERRFVQPFVVFYSNRNITGSTLEELEAAGDVFEKPLTRDDGDSRGPEFSGDAEIPDVDTGSDARIWIAIAAQDDVGNLSEPTYPEGDGAQNGFEPVPVIDFWEGYKEAGGQESGGCSAAPGAPVDPVAPVSILFAVIGMGWLGWRRRRRLRQLLGVSAAVLAFGATVGVSADAAAQSPTWGMAEIRLGGYYPSIDDESGLSGQPFQESFGASNRVLLEYEQGLHLYDGFGAFGVSASLGYTHFGGEIELEDAVGADVEGLNESTGFMVVPARAGLYYRVDQFEKTWDIPLVPVVKAGLDYVLWQAEDPGGEAATSGGDEGEGGTAGWHVSAGLHLLLDWIDPTSAASFDYTWGINNTYAFAEYMHMEVDDFGSSDSFILSDDLWMFGLSFEY
jgi:hypothetical protein